MSSSQSNASARRRRAQPTVPPSKNSIAGRVPPNEPQFKPDDTNQNNQNNQTQNKPLYESPAQMLIAHEGRINKIEELVNNLPSSDNSDTEENNKYVSRISELEERISQLEHQYKMLQIFSVETNVALMKILDLSKTASNFLNNDIKQELMASKETEETQEETQVAETQEETTTSDEVTFPEKEK